MAKSRLNLGKFKIATMERTMPELAASGYPTGLQIHTRQRAQSDEERFAEFLLDIRQQMSRIAQQVFDASHPVDEYQSGSGIPSGLQIEVQPTYDKFSERIDTILIVVGSTATGLVLQLGDRSIPLAPFAAANQNTPNVTQPAVPASATAIQNTNPFPVQVVITGGTLTAVTVNGQQVGTTAGTYIVPSGGTISITYTVAPTWQWNAFAFNFQSPFASLNSGLYIINNAGFVLKSHERRLLTATSWGNTNGYYVGLFGHASDVFETV